VGNMNGREHLRGVVVEEILKLIINKYGLSCELDLTAAKNIKSFIKSREIY
jgi:hypothetical protein